MTRPGDPGYAASARASATGATSAVDEGPDLPLETDPPSRREWTLQRQLLLVLAGLLAAVSAVVGVVSVSVFHTSSMAAVEAAQR